MRLILTLFNMPTGAARELENVSVLVAFDPKRHAITGAVATTGLALVAKFTQYLRSEPTLRQDRILGLVALLDNIGCAA